MTNKYDKILGEYRENDETTVETDPLSLHKDGTSTASAAIPLALGVITGKIYPSADSTTAVQINKANGTTNVVNVDTTNGRVGIGTVVPTQALDVSGASGLDGATPTTININSTNNGTWTDESIFSQVTFSNADASGTGDGGVKAKISAYVDDTTAADNGLAFYTTTDGTTIAERMRINHAGNVGIGTTTPTSTLQVVGSLSADTFSNTGTSTFAGDISITKDTPRLYLVDNAGGTQLNMSMYSNLGVWALNDDTNGQIAMQYSLANGVRVTNLFGVIGAAQPGVLRLQSGSDTILTNDVFGQVGFYTADGSTDGTGYMGIIQQQATANFEGGNHASSMIFKVMPLTGTTQTEVMRLTHGGLVGIGTTAPENALDINSATGENLQLTYNDSNGSAANKVNFAVSSSGDLTITPSGGDAAVAGNLTATNLSGTNTGNQIGDGVTITGAGTVADPFVAAGVATVYPIGCIYTTIDPTNPSTIFGFGTWVAFGSGKVLVGLDSGDTNFDTVEETGGAKTVASSAQSFSGDASTAIVNHTHDTTVYVGTTDGTYGTFDSSSTTPGSAKTITTGNPKSGGVASYTPTGTNTAGAATSVIQPYVVVYFFKRTA